MTVEDRFSYGGLAVRAVWCAGPWRPDAALVRQCSGLCFDERGRMLLVSADGQRWALPGGHPEPGETLEAVLEREVWEEACARVTALAFLGCQRIHESAGGQSAPVYYQARFWARVALEPFEPRHETVERRLLAPADVPALLGWGESPILAHLLRLAAARECARGQESAR